MVGIFYGREFVGVSENEQTAIKGLYKAHVSEEKQKINLETWKTEEKAIYKWWNGCWIPRSSDGIPIQIERGASSIWEIKEVKIF